MCGGGEGLRVWGGWGSGGVSVCVCGWKGKGGEDECGYKRKHETKKNLKKAAKLRHFTTTPVIKKTNTLSFVRCGSVSK